MELVAVGNEVAAVEMAILTAEESRRKPRLFVLKYCDSARSE